MSFISPGSSSQIVYQLLTTVISVVVLNNYRPYNEDLDNYLALLAQWTLFGIALITLLIKFNIVGESISTNGSQVEQYNQTALNFTLTVLFFVVPVVTVLRMIFRVAFVYRDLLFCIDWDKVEQKVKNMIESRKNVDLRKQITDGASRIQNRIKSVRLQDLATMSSRFLLRENSSGESNSEVARKNRKPNEPMTLDEFFDDGNEESRGKSPNSKQAPKLLSGVSPVSKKGFSTTVEKVTFNLPERDKRAASRSVSSSRNLLDSPSLSTKNLDSRESESLKFQPPLDSIFTKDDLISREQSHNSQTDSPRRSARSLSRNARSLSRGNVLSALSSRMLGREDKTKEFWDETGEEEENKFEAMENPLFQSPKFETTEEKPKSGIHEKQPAFAIQEPELGTPSKEKKHSGFGANAAQWLKFQTFRFSGIKILSRKTR